MATTLSLQELREQHPDAFDVFVKEHPDTFVVTDDNKIIYTIDGGGGHSDLDIVWDPSTNDWEELEPDDDAECGGDCDYCDCDCSSDEG